MKSPLRRQWIRKTLIILSFVLLPATFVYISCPIIIRGASEGIATGGLILFILLFASSLFVGRLWCGWLCPAGGLQEIYFAINNRPAKESRLKWLKYIMFPAIILIPLLSAIQSTGGFSAIDLFYYTEHAISIAKPGAYIIFFVQVAFLTAFALLGGRRGFCNYFCPIAVIMIAGRTIRNLIRWPALRLAATGARCTGCKRCSNDCPMGLDVVAMVQHGRMENTECILCGVCADVCPQQAIHFEI
ncbi:MAG: Ferredoxin [Methanosaeta sp. PtaU1.Bin112]|nr:MAG: Ferredoxin [Methanosaeta sp. PtaU1.Bin112]